MIESSAQNVSDQGSETNDSPDGVSFQGKSLKLNTEEDCDEVVKAIGDCENLVYLNLEGNTLGVEASKAISKALETKSGLKRALWKDMFTGRMKEEIPEALLNLGSGLTLAGARLTELDLSDNAFGPIGVKGLAGLLSSQVCYQLEELKLNNTGLGTSGGKMLAQALLECHKNSMKEGKTLALKMFIAGRNRLENDGAAALAKVFETLGTLEEIAMPQNGIYPEGIKAISKSLKNNPNLRVLNLNDNTVREKGANHIAAVLPHLQKLQVLNLGDCLLGQGAVVLADALLEEHHDLEELYVEYNEIDENGGMAVGNVLKNKSKLKSFNLSGNSFGKHGKNRIKESLAENEKLLSMWPHSEGEDSDNDYNENDDDDDDDKVDIGDDYDEENEDDDVNYDEEDEDEDVNYDEEEDVDDEEDDDDDDDDDDNDDEDEDENEEDDDVKDEIKENGYSSIKEIPMQTNKINSPIFKIRSSMHPTMDDLSGLLEDCSIKAKPVGPLKTFLDVPTVGNFLAVEENQVYEFIKNNQDSSVDFYTETFIPIIVKISSLSNCGNPEGMKQSLQVARNLYKILFSWATQKNHLSTINNALFVHLGLIKSEDKNFKINWDVKGSLDALKTIISEDYVPETTQDILRCCLEREKNLKK